MRKSVATLSMAGSLAEKLQAIARAGFNAVELFYDDLTDFAGTARDVRRLADDLGLDIVMLQPLREGDDGRPERRASLMAEGRAMLDAMGELGCRQLLTCSSVKPEASAEPDRQTEALCRLAELARPYGVSIGYEALAWGAHVKHYRQAWQRVREARQDNLGLVLDSFHILALGDTPQGLADIPLDKLHFVQMADAGAPAAPDLSVQQWSRHQRCFPGEGVLDTAGFARVVSQQGYQGVWSLEIFNDAYQRAPASNVAVNGFASLCWLEQAIKQGDERARPQDGQ